MKKEIFSCNLPLTGSGIDQIARQIEDFLQSLHMERQNRLRIRLSVEEALLHWREHFGEAARIRLVLSASRHPYIQLELTGEAYNPLCVGEDSDWSDWGTGLLSAMGLAPRFFYSHGCNVLRLALPRRQRNPLLSMLLAIGAGILVGILGEALLPVAVQESIYSSVLSPVRNAFSRLLNLASGPVIFFMIVSAVCGTGKLTRLGGDSRRLVLRYFYLCLLLTLGTTCVAALCFPMAMQQSSLGRELVAGTLEHILRVIPSDLFTPFTEGDSPQIILLAIIVGDALLVAGSRTEGITKLADQANLIGMQLAEWVSRIVPLFTFLLLILEIWSGTLNILLGLWKPFLLFAILAGLFLALKILKLSRTVEAPVKLLAKKTLRGLWQALRSQSVEKTYALSEQLCENSLGIEKAMVTHTLPLGTILYMPASALATVLMLCYGAHSYGISASPMWYATAVVLTVLLVVAAPPVTGVGLLTYAALFTELEVPTDALTVAMAADVFFQILAGAINQTMLQLEILQQAERMGLLNRSVLLEEEKKPAAF